ncbi:MAG: hypothetical protein BVN35_09590 [Proteobacteria bacterium ST_bin11]|nr:MAG: hypothetical protein BVN35_09590 [Proteobacteria bacterium ST_bin11]
MVLVPDGVYTLSVDPALVTTDTPAATDGELNVGTNTKDIADKDTDVTEEPVSASFDLVKMTRETPVHADGPTTADVHPDELFNWLAAGWALATDQAEGE